MSFEELLQEHIKALNENTKALNAYTKALNNDSREVEVEYTKDSACKFCGISYKTLQAYIADGSLSPSRRKTGTREYFKEKDLIAFCNTKRLYSGDFGSLRNDPRSVYFGR